VRAIVLVGLVATAAVLGTIEGAGGQADEVARGHDLYVTGCSSCHGADGAGTDRGPDLRESGPAAVDFYLSTGRMPMSGPDEQAQRKPPAYDEEEIAALVAYIDTFSVGPRIPDVDPDEGDLVAGNLSYGANCAACHNSAGSGGAVGPSVLAPDLYAATPLQTAEAIRVGPGAMPRFSEGQVDQQELDDLVRYVAHLDRPTDRGGLPLGRVGPVPEGLVAWILGLGTLLLFCFWIGTTERRGGER
jgi:ubiquinol-cytochrome c reductase cytochrome c subunit